MDTSASIRSGEIRRDVHSNNPPSKLRTYGFAILIIVGIGSLAVAGVGLGGFGVQLGWWQVGVLSNLSQIHSIIMMTAGGGGGILFLIIGIVGSVKNKANIGRGLDGLLTKEVNLNQEIDSTNHQAALNFAHKLFEEHPEVKHTDYDWGCFAKQGIFGADDKSPSNPEISRLSYIFSEIWLPKFNLAVEQEDPWADNERAEVADTCLKLSYALVCLTCDDMPDMQRKLPKRHADGFHFGCQYSYQYRWIVWHTKIYQSVRNVSDKQDHSQRFYQEGTIQSQWRNMFNLHCDYVAQCGWGLGDSRYYKWFTKDTQEQPLQKLDSRFDLPT